MPYKICANCGDPVNDSELCGCGLYVCPDCLSNIPKGPHSKSEHCDTNEEEDS